MKSNRFLFTVGLTSAELGKQFLRELENDSFDNVSDFFKENPNKQKNAQKLFLK